MEARKVRQTAGGGAGRTEKRRPENGCEERNRPWGIWSRNWPRGGSALSVAAASE